MVCFCSDISFTFSLPLNLLLNKNELWLAASHLSQMASFCAVFFGQWKLLWSPDLLQSVWRHGHARLG